MISVLLISISCSLLVLPYSEAIKCYSCITTPLFSSKAAPEWPFPIPTEQCGEFPSSLLVDCPDATVCHSIIADLNADGLDGKQTIGVRACGNGLTTQVCQLIGTRSVSLEGSCYTCDTDGCNSAMSATLSLSLLISAIAIFKFFH